MPVRIAAPGGHRRPRRHPAQPELQHGRRAPPVGRDQPDRGRAAPLRVGAGGRRPRAPARRPPEHLPVETRELTVRTGNGRGLFDLTGACAAFVGRRVGGGTGCCRSSCPHATAGLVIVEIGAGSDDDLLAALDRLLPREERLYRHRHGSPGPRRRPRPAAARAAVADRAGRRRAAGARDVAVDLPARPQQRQRRPGPCAWRSSPATRLSPASPSVRRRLRRCDRGRGRRLANRSDSRDPSRRGAGPALYSLPTQRPASAPATRPPAAPTRLTASRPTARGHWRTARCRCVPIPRTSR